MSKIIKKSLSIIMIIGIMGCGQQVEKPEGKGKSLNEVLIDVGRSAENVFYAFIELVSDVLGFAAKATTTKQQVGDYFSGLGAKLEKASDELEAVAKKSEIDIEKDGLSNKTIRSAIDVAKGVLGTLKGHLEFLKDIGDSSLVGEVKNDNKQGVAANTDGLKKLHHALTGIITAAKKEGVEELKENKLTLGQALIGGANPEHGAKVLGTNANPAAGDSGKAAVILASVSGEEMLDAIVKSSVSDADAELGGNADAGTSALKFAKGGQAARVAQGAAKAAAVAGGIALRSLVKGGKLASENNNDDEKAVQSVGITAVNKLLKAVEEVIKKTVKNVVEKAKVEIDKARSPQVSISKPSGSKE
ncbi:variable large family protein [Borrelia persica]|uniref:variable large family protein n=1 Tax=Borrelia persica TaxID=44448 RepID=UPI00056E4817|nr:variable large family protein [Borrelia persica]